LTARSNTLDLVPPNTGLLLEMEPEACGQELLLCSTHPSIF